MSQSIRVAVIARFLAFVIGGDGVPHVKCAADGRGVQGAKRRGPAQNVRQTGHPGWAKVVVLQKSRHAPRMRGIQYAGAFRFWSTGSPACAGDDNRECDALVQHRHCERSEAIHSFFVLLHGLLRFARNDA
jgi:hypothetical protein